MKKQSLSFALVVAAMLPYTLSAFAEPTAPIRSAARSEVSTPVSRPAEIPQSAAIAIVFPNEITIDAGKQQDYPVTAILAEPIFDLNGKEAIPAKSPVTLSLKPAPGGVQIIAESVIFRGRVMLIQAEGPIIPGMVVTESNNKDQARDNSAIYSRLFGSLMGAFSGNDSRSTVNIERATLLGSGIGTLTGATSPKTMLVVKISAGSMYVLSLKIATTLPIENSPAQPGSTPKL